MISDRIFTIYRKIINSAVGWSIGGVLIRLGSGVLLLPLILHKLPPEQLGLWYVFNSIGALLFLLDLGISSTSSRAISYLWAGARELKAHGVANVPEEYQGKPNMDLLRDLLSTIRVYYLLAALVAAVLLLSAGTVFIYSQSKELENNHWIMPSWILYVLFNVYGLYATYWSAALGGIGAVNTAARILTISQIASLVVISVTVLWGFGLLGMVMGSAVSGILSRIWSSNALKSKLGIRSFSARNAKYHLFKILWPQSWRLGMTIFGGYLTLHSSTLICSIFLGLSEVATYGLTIQLIGMLTGVSTILIEVKGPEMNILRAHSDTKGLVALFISRLRASLALYTIGAVVMVVMGQWLLDMIDAKTNLVPLPELLILLVTNFVHVHYSRHAVLALTSNQNPFVIPNLASGIAIALLSCILSPALSVLGIVLAKGIVEIGFCGWWYVKKGLESVGLSVTAYIKLVFSANLRWI